MPEVSKVTLMCHPFGKLRAGSEAKPKDLANENKILRFPACRQGSE